VAWFTNAGALPGGTVLLILGLPLLAALVARRTFRDVTEGTLWIAAFALAALVAGGWLATRTAPGHAELVDRLTPVGQVLRRVSLERTGSDRCRPQCAGVVARYESGSAPDVAVATAVAVLGSRDITPAEGAGTRTLEDRVGLRGRHLVGDASVRADGDVAVVTIRLRSQR
jgi:hypothetical protein